MSRPRYRKPRIIAPRLANGDKRESIGHGLPPHIKDGIRSIARQENKSISWVLEQVIIEYFGLKRPEYVPVKKYVNPKEAPNESDARARIIPYQSGNQTSSGRS